MARKGKAKMQTEAEKIANRVAERERTGFGTATLERLLKAGADGHEHTPATPQHPGGIQRVTEAPLDRLFRQGFVSTAEFESGDRYRADAYLAAVEPTIGSVDWNSAGGHSSGARLPPHLASMTIYDARNRVRAIEGRMSGVIRVVARLALIKEAGLAEIGTAVFGFGDRKEAAIAGKVATRMACGALVDLYRG